MNVEESLEKLLSLAKKDEELKQKLLATVNQKDQVEAFCKIAGEAGVEISVLDMIYAGQEAYAAMRRSTNGGGENAPLLEGEDDYYELFISRLNYGK
ncbi:MAG: Nif11-like leader peptide family natural product precursor [Lachnospiraceae bacterium]|nr:Nif11-like leader peptide family natural product precursor [Lachnospiraceae bacterium]